MKTVNISRYIALLLRHQPEKAGLCLDKHGWAEVGALIEGVKQRYPEFNKEILDEIVARDSKQRYAYNYDQTMIRANQGHSIPVDVELKQSLPTAILYHGTGGKNMYPQYKKWVYYQNQDSMCIYRQIFKQLFR